MKVLLVALSLLSSGVALAVSPPQPPSNLQAPPAMHQGLREDVNTLNRGGFEERKAVIHQRLTEMAQNTQKEADCVSKAKNPQDLDSCREAAHALRRDIREHAMEQHRLHERQEGRSEGGFRPGEPRRDPPPPLPR